MSADLPRLSGVRSTPVSPPAPPKPEPSRALLPIAPANPGSGTAARNDGPLGRSGVSVVDLLATNDLLLERGPVAPVALEVGLEQARGALLRRQPGEVLEALDAVWARARHSEEGWYLRAGALSVLGLADESDRIAAAGLERAPRSLALRFVQSVARMLAGDIGGARAALLPALDAAPEDPVLLAQTAVLQARQGRGPEAEVLIGRLAAQAAPHPAVTWAQEEIRAIRLAHIRAGARAGVSMPARQGEADVPSTGSFDGPPLDAARMEPEPDPVTTAPVSDGTTDLKDPGADDAFARLGVRLTLAGGTEAIDAVRTLVRAFSTGGAFAAASPADQAHGARTLLVSMLAALKTDQHQPVPAVVRQLVSALRDGRIVEAERTLRREARVLPFTQRRWFDALLRDLTPATVVRPSPSRAQEAVRTAARPDGAGTVRDELEGNGAPDPLFVREPRTSTPIASPAVHDAKTDPTRSTLSDAAVPVRLGLSLLADSPEARRAAFDAVPSFPADRAMADRTMADPHAAVGAPARAPVDDPDGRGAASMVAVRFDRQARPPSLDLGAVLPPVLAVAVAVAAGLNGAMTVAGVALLAAAWLAVRKRTVSIEPALRRTETTTPSESGTD